MAEQNKHLAPGSDYLLSLSSIVGNKVVDLQGYVDRNFDVPVFKVSKVVFEDGTAHWMQGEHDIAYIPCQEDGPLGEDNLNAIDPEDPDEDEDNDD